jgi:uncharacterized cupredoxin-like copper-binding protein
VTRRWTLATAAAALALAGCATIGQQAGTGMGGQGMMRGDSTYHYSRLTCSAPSELPGTTVYVMLGDMGMTQMMGGTAPLGARMILRAVPASVSAGPVSLVATNMGWRTHELVILPLAVGASAGQRVPWSDGKVAESGSVGEASTSCEAGAGDGITAGSVGWTTVTLAPGRYELICDLPNHYADGMHQEIAVTA